MTAEEKYARKQLRAKLTSAVLANHFREAKHGLTNRQLRAAARNVVDQLLAGKAPGTCYTLNSREHELLELLKQPGEIAPDGRL